MRILAGSIFRRGTILAATSVSLYFAGCNGDPAAPRAEGSRHQQPHLPPLAGHDTFFNGRITAELTVGHGPGFTDNTAPEGDEPGPERKRRAGGGSIRIGAGGEGGHGQHHGGYSEPGGMTDPFERQQQSNMRSAVNPNPPVMIHLRFTNNGPDQVELLVADFLSPLGNFVVEPEKLSLAPGQSLEVEPMTSRLAGEISGTTVTLALRWDGHGDKKVIALSVPTETAPATPPTETTSKAR